MKVTDEQRRELEKILGVEGARLALLKAERMSAALDAVGVQAKAKAGPDLAPGVKQFTKAVSALIDSPARRKESNPLKNFVAPLFDEHPSRAAFIRTEQGFIDANSAAGKALLAEHARKSGHSAIFKFLGPLLEEK